ncbi:MAG: D-glycerate dehydrogenase, partial [Planctomycetota bacterium]
FNSPIGDFERLSAHADVTVWPDPLPPSQADLHTAIAGCHGVLTLLSDAVDTAFMNAAGESLRVISQFAVGYNNIDVDTATARGIAVGNTPDVLTDATADLAISLLLAAARNMKQGIDDVRDGKWKTWEPIGYMGQGLAGKTLGIIGMGRIGLATAQRLMGGWGMRCLYTSRSDKPDADAAGAQRTDLETLLRESDVVSIHTDLNESTRQMINHETIAWMRPHAVLVNTARGGVIDQDALAAALHNRKIFAAGLDVTDPEPLPPDHALVQLENCVILPHVGSGTIEARNNMADIAANNIIAGLKGDPLPCAVNEPLR